LTRLSSRHDDRSIPGFVDILASQRNGTFYTGLTANLLRRVQQHREKPEGFVAQYQVWQLVWYEEHESIEAAIRREKAIKKGKPVWKLDLIEGFNPGWRDLWPEIAS
jgi:putative endonuclease